MAVSGGIQGAGQGASMGMAFGPWGAAIGAVAGFFIGSSEEDKVQKQRAKAIEEQATLMRREMARAQGDIRRARTMSILNTAGAINYINRVTGQIKADISVQNATADAIGASVVATYSNADVQADQAKNQELASLQYQLANQAESLSSQLNQSRMGLRQLVEQSKQGDTSKQDMSSGLLNLGQVGGSLWAGGAFKSKTPTSQQVGPTNRAGVF